MARALAATGLTPTRAYDLARLAEADMGKRREVELDLDRLAEIATEVLGESEAARTMRRLRRLQALQQLELPIFLLVGGATGTGKSTLATETAHRLGITRVTSTDFIRQTMRAFFSREFMPSVHFSSFDAELGLSRADEDVGRCRTARVPRPDAERARRRRGGDRPLAHRGLVDGARGRAHRARDDLGRPHGRARRPVRGRDQRRGSPPEPLLGAGRRRPTACGRSRSTSTG